jgi:excisionase family DNA binding protein
MSKRPWPDDTWPTPDQLLEWCRTAMTSDVTPYLQGLIDAAREKQVLITAEEAAARVGVSRMTIYRWAEEGRIRSARVGPRLIRINAADIDAISPRRGCRRDSRHPEGAREAVALGFL